MGDKLQSSPSKQTCHISPSLTETTEVFHPTPNQVLYDLINFRSGLGIRKTINSLCTLKCHLKSYAPSVMMPKRSVHLFSHDENLDERESCKASNLEENFACILEQGNLRSLATLMLKRSQLEGCSTKLFHLSVYT